MCRANYETTKVVLDYDVDPLDSDLYEFESFDNNSGYERHMKREWWKEYVRHRRIIDLRSRNSFLRSQLIPAYQCSELSNKILSQFYYRTRIVDEMGVKPPKIGAYIDLVKDEDVYMVVRHHNCDVVCYGGAFVGKLLQVSCNEYCAVDTNGNEIFTLDLFGGNDELLGLDNDVIYFGEDITVYCIYLDSCYSTDSDTLHVEPLDDIHECFKRFSCRQGFPDDVGDVTEQSGKPVTKLDKRKLSDRRFKEHRRTERIEEFTNDELPAAVEAAVIGKDDVDGNHVKRLKEHFASMKENSGICSMEEMFCERLAEFLETMDIPDDDITKNVVSVVICLVSISAATNATSVITAILSLCNATHGGIKGKIGKLYRFLKTMISGAPLEPQSGVKDTTTFFRRLLKSKAVAYATLLASALVTIGLVPPAKFSMGPIKIFEARAFSNRDKDEGLTIIDSVFEALFLFL